jgi:hypothetical protein
MPQQFTQSASNTFVKGLITEAGELTFPKDASVDELNCDLKRDGSRRRRLGIKYEDSYVLDDMAVLANEIVSTHTWENVGGEAGVEFLCVQVGNSLIFFQKVGATISTNRVDTTYTSGVAYELTLSDYNRPVGSGAGKVAIQVTSINGGLIVASAEINTILITRDISDGSFTVEEIEFLTRDFAWQGDTSDYLSQSATSSPGVARQYDTANTGWVGTKGAAALSAYRSANASKYPALTLPWYAGKDTNDDFSESEWQKDYAGNSLIANGHFILDLYSKDRDTASGLSGVTTSTESARFSAVTTYAGRVFYSGMENAADFNGSKIYFSPVLVTGFDDIGKCYQINDPTSEVLSDLLDTDGGFLSIPEAYNIQRLHVFGPTLYVFAENGVWSVSGVDDVFRATEYSVSKLTEVGLSYPTSFVSANGRPYWWSTRGIHTLTVSTELKVVQEQNISISTIQSFWEDIGDDERSRVDGIYDAINSRVLWLYPDVGETNSNKFNNILLLDETLQAFFPWSISDETASTSYIIGASFYDGAGFDDVEFTVVDSNGNEVVDSSGNTVVVTRDDRSYFSSSVKFLIRDGSTGKITFAGFTGSDFLDWGTVNYESFAETGYDFFGDLSTFKNAPYVVTYCKVTETGWVLNDTGYDPVRGSSMLVSTYWDFKTTTSSNAQQAYRLKRIPVVDPDNLSTFGYPWAVITTRLKCRGRGRSMRIRFESEQGKDFHLLGYEVIGARNPRF